MKSALVLTVALIACEQSPSKLDAVVKPAGASAPTGDTPRDLDARLTRLEHRLDKVIGALEQALPPPDPDPDATYAVAIDAVDPVQGPKDAKVTIVEGFEFLCPYCFMVDPTVDQLLQKYPKDVRLVSKYLIIHGQPAIAPGMAACAAAKQGKYKEMKATLWSHLFTMDGVSPRVQTEAVNLDNIVKLAREIGLDAAKLKTDMTGSDCERWLSASQESLHPVGANATPAFFINGHYVGGAQPFEVFDKVIDQELAKADKAIADGVPQTDYYQHVMASGQKRVKGRFED